MKKKKLGFTAAFLSMVLLLSSCDLFVTNYTYTFDNRSSYQIYINDSYLEPPEMWVSPGTVKTAESEYDDLNLHRKGGYVSFTQDGRRYIFTDNPEGLRENY